MFDSTHPPHTALRRRFAVVAATLLAVTLAACGGGGSDDDLDIPADDRYDLSGQQVRIGTAAETTLDLGTSYGVELMSGWGADVQREELTDVSGLQAIVADRIDVSARSSDEVIDGRSRGIDIVAFGAPASSMHYVIVGSPDLKSVADLDGGTIATSGPGGFDTVLFDALLDQEGLTRGEDVKEVAIGGSAERAASIVAGQADASMVFLDDWLSLSEQTDDIDLVEYVAKLLPGLSARTLAATREWLDANQDMATALACANLEANQWIADDAKGFVEMATTRVTGTTPEAAEAFRDEAIDLGMFPTNPQDVLDPAQYEQTANVMLKGGALDAEVNLEGAVDTSYLEKAASQGCGTD